MELLDFLVSHLFGICSIMANISSWPGIVHALCNTILLLRNPSMQIQHVSCVQYLGCHLSCCSLSRLLNIHVILRAKLCTVKLPSLSFLCLIY